MLHVRTHRHFLYPGRAGSGDPRHYAGSVRRAERKGYNPINQIVGYILSEDPTYITTYKNARSIIRKVDRDDLLQALVRNFITL